VSQVEAPADGYLTRVGAETWGWAGGQDKLLSSTYYIVGIRRQTTSRATTLRARTEVFSLVCKLCMDRSNILHEAKLVPTVGSRTPQKAGAAYVADRWEGGPWAYRACLRVLRRGSGVRVWYDR
jgi:hypothetical protein